MAVVVAMGAAVATDGQFARRAIAVMAVVAAILVTLTGLASALSTPPRTGAITDQAGILDQQAISALSARLGKIREASGAEVVIVTLESLQGASVETWGDLLGDTWKVGKASGRDDGIVLVVAPNDRRVRLAVGYGLGNRISNRIAEDIVSDHILPYFRSGDYRRGITAGIDSIALQLGSPAASNVAAGGTAQAQPWYSLPILDRVWLRANLPWILPVLAVLLVVLINWAWSGEIGLPWDFWSDDDDGYSGDGMWSSSSSSSSFSGSGSSGGSFGGGASGSW